MRVTEPYTIFIRKLPSGKEVYYYQFRYPNGRRSVAKSTGCTSLSKAKRFCQKMYNSGEFDKEEAPTFKVYTDGYFAPDSKYCKLKIALNNKPLKPKTLDAYNVALSCQLLPFFENYRMNEINADVVKDWVIWACEKWSAKTVNNAQAILNIILESAVDKDYLVKNPLHRIGMRKLQKKRRELFTVEELHNLYWSDWTLESHRQIFLLACITGMRVGEICALKWTDVKGNYLDVKKTFSDDFGLQESTKTGLSRFVPIPRDFAFPKGDSEYVFVGLVENEPVSPHREYNAVMRRIDKLGIDRKSRGLTVHSLRDFFVSYLRSQNVSDPKIRAVVGHADETMTDLYTYWKPDMFPEVYEAQRKLYEQITKEE